MTDTDDKDARVRDVIIIGGGLAGLSAAIYLGRSRRDTLLIHSGRSMAKWEDDVQNYLGFPEGIAGSAILERGRRQVERFGVDMVEDEVYALSRHNDVFDVGIKGKRSLRAQRVLLATGLTHLPPEIPGVRECLGRSLFFCKDCDAYRVQGQGIVIIGHNNEAADYALAMRLFSPSVLIATNGHEPAWDRSHVAWVEEYRVPVRHERITGVEHDDGRLRALTFEQSDRVMVDAAFATRGDITHADLAQSLGAKVDANGQVTVDACLRTSVPGLYAAGCVTPANCQMIIAAGQGAIAAQAINRDLFEESLARHTLPCFGQPAKVRNA
jgi:thioredoxin reductase (NADPH)